MGQYKVPQDVEAEDQIIGTLTFKQFVYALIGVGWAIICYALFKSNIIIVIISAAPITMLFLALAVIKINGQNFEQYLIALVGFVANSRQRLWRKDDMVETFYIEPRPAEAEQTQRDPAQVRSDLERVAALIDSRGWNSINTGTVYSPGNLSSDRLINPTIPKDELRIEANDVNDILDLSTSPLTQNLDEMISNASFDIRREAIMNMRRTAEELPPAIPVESPVGLAVTSVSIPVPPAVTSEPILQPAPVVAVVNPPSAPVTPQSVLQPADLNALTIANITGASQNVMTNSAQNDILSTTASPMDSIIPTPSIVPIAAEQVINSQNNASS